MHPSSFIILAIFLLQTVSTQPFSYHQYLDGTSTSSIVYAIDLSKDNSLMCIAWGNQETWIYTQTSGTFALDDKFTNQDFVYTCDLTADGQYLLQAGDPTVNVYKYASGTQSFTLFQTITLPDGSSKSQTGAITDDHQWVVYGTIRDNIYVLKFNGSAYQQDQVISPGYQARTLALSQDLFLVVGSFDVNNVEVYKHNGTQFNLFQTITAPEDADRVKITDDHAYITLNDHNLERISRYYYDQDTGQFEAFQNDPTITVSNSLQTASVSQSKQWLIAAHYNTTIYTNLEGSVSLVQTITGPNVFHKISTDSQYLILADTGQLNIHKLACDVSAGEYYDTDVSQCRVCSDTVTDALDETGACVHCAADNYYFDGNGQCQLCDPNTGYEIVGEECLFCGGRAGCSNCANGQCTACQENLDYFLTNGTCEQCSIEGCSDCSDLNTCLTCNENNNYFLDNNNQCTLCSIDWCSKCQDLNTCKTCESNYVLENGLCVKDDQNGQDGQDGQDGQEQDGEFPLAALAAVPVVIIIVGVTVYLCKKKQSVTTVGDEPSKREIGNVVDNVNYSYDERFPASKIETKIIP